MKQLLTSEPGTPVLFPVVTLLSVIIVVIV